MPVQMNSVNNIKAHLGIDPNGKVQKFFTNTCRKHMDRFVPQDDGNLRTIVDIGDDRVIYESPYAKYQYYGIRQDGTHAVKNYTTPGTGPYWDKRMWANDKETILKELQNKLRSK